MENTKTTTGATPGETRDALMSIKSLAEFLDCGETYAARLVSSGTIPSAKIGSLRRVRTRDVLDYIERSMANARAPKD